MKFITVVAIAALFYMSTCESRELMRNRRAVAKEEGEKSHDSKMDEAHAQPAKRYYPGPGLGPGAWGGEPMCWYLDGKLEGWNLCKS